MYSEPITDVFFDLDHTLWDFERNSALTFQHIFASHNITVPLAQFLAVYIPINLAYWKLYREDKVTKEELRHNRLKKAFEKLDIEISDASIYALSMAYITHLSSFNHIFKGTLEILDYLTAKYRLHIITNGFEEVQEKKMQNSGILHYFDVVVNSEMAGVKKPDPKIFHLALHKVGVEPKNSIMIGDSLEADILGAKKVGMHALHFDSHYGPDHDVCPKIAELHEIKAYL